MGFLQAAQPRASDDATRRDRLVLVMVNEAARVLAEGVVESPEDVDFGMIMGTGWAPFRGGPLRHADALGIGEVVRRLETLARAIAPHFEPCDYLREMAEQQLEFYSGINPPLPGSPTAAAAVSGMRSGAPNARAASGSTVAGTPATMPPASAPPIHSEHPSTVHETV
jgi:hypothetical protein